jgi:hypothetical protein
MRDATILIIYYSFIAAGSPLGRSAFSLMIFVVGWNLVVFCSYKKLKKNENWKKTMKVNIDDIENWILDEKSTCCLLFVYALERKNY